jgi:glutathione reductase (NADPH)
VAIAEERYWGGTCVNVGCVPKKLMVMASDYSAAVADSHGFGWDTMPGAHDWAAFLAAKDAEIGRLNGIYRTLMAGCTTFDARAVLVGPHRVEVEGRVVTAEHIVIATGGRPVAPDFPGGELCIISDEAFHLPAMPRRVVIVGGGYIAVEFAGIFAGLGASVDLVMRQELPLRGFDEDLRAGLAEALESSGIRLHRRCTVARVTQAGEARRVVLSDGTEIAADLVFAAVGRHANTAGLGLDKVNVAVNAAGAVIVDDTLQTSAAGIHAIGDVTDRINLTPVAIAEGHSLAERLFGDGPRVWDLSRVASAVFSQPPLASVGLTEAQAAALGPVDIYLSRFTPMRHALSKRARKTVMKLVVDQATQKVLGAHMLGEDAPEIVQGLSIAINCGATKADFDRTVGIHPTAAEEFVTMRTRTRVAGVATASAAA